MSDPVMSGPPLLDTYRDSFLPVYERVCGDTASYDRIGANLDNFLNTRMVDNLLERNGQRANKYTKVLRSEATPQEASDLFVEFLEEGNGCHPHSPAGMARYTALSIARAADPNAEHFTRGLTVRSTPTRLHSEWQQFLSSYMEKLFGALAAIDDTMDKETSPADLRRMVWQTTNRLEILANVVGATLKPMLSDPPRTLVWSMLRIQWARMNNFRTSVVMLRDSAAPDSHYTEELYELIADLKETVRTLIDPFDWVDKVVRRYPNEATSRVKMSVSNDVRRYESRNAVALWQLIDWIFIVADNIGTDDHPVNVTFSINDRARSFVISLPAIDTRSIAYLDLLVRRMEGSRVVTSAGHDIPGPVYEFRVPVTRKEGPPAGSGPDDPAAGNDHGMVPPHATGSVGPSAQPLLSGAQSMLLPAAFPLVARPALIIPLSSGMMR